MSGECPKERIVRKRELRYQAGQLFYSLLGINEIYGGLISKITLVRLPYLPITERNLVWSSRVKMLAGSSRMKVLSNPAMACGSQYSSEASKSTSPSVNGFAPRLNSKYKEHRRT